MGMIADIHTGQSHAIKAQGSFIAATRMCALSQVLHALASFDEAGHYFWSGDKPKAKQSVEVAFGLLRSSREELASITDLEAKITATASDDTATTGKVEELGLKWPSEEIQTRALAGDRRIMAMIAHMLLVEEQAIAAVDSADLKPLYIVVSTPARTLAEQVCKHMTDVINDSRLTYELSDVVNQALVKDGVVAPEVEFVGPNAG